MAKSSDKGNGQSKGVIPRLAGKLRGVISRMERGSADQSNAHIRAFVSRVRQYDFASYSDLDLRERVAELRAAPSAHGEPKHLEETFAITNESVKRRLGAWKLFETETESAGFTRYRDLAVEFLESRAKDDVPSISVASKDNSYAEIALVNGIAQVMKNGQTKHSSDILLQADFYIALSEFDATDSLKFDPTDEQLIAGHLLFEGNIVEMDSGEGKTVAAAFPAALQAICGKAVHIITSNDYLATRDAEYLAPVYESVGLTVGFVAGYMSDEERRYAYTQNIVYGTLREFAFDYLRDNLRMPSADRVQGSLDVVIVDEADHALIDQASTPLIISGQPAGYRRGLKKAVAAIESLVDRQMALATEIADAVMAGSSDSKKALLNVAMLMVACPESEVLGKCFAASPETYGRVLNLIDDDSEESDSQLAAGLYYIVDPRSESVSLTESGHRFLEDRLGPVFDTSGLEDELDAVIYSVDLDARERKRLGARLRRRIATQYGQMNQLYQLLRAFVLVKGDVDYLVDDGKVVLVDELTGRTLPDNIYNRGLHAAVQAKERVAIEPERETLAQISVQGFLKQYSLLSGLTGTALDAKDEFMRQYGLQVVRVASSRPPVRIDFGTRVYKTNDDKLATIVDEIAQCQVVGRPVLVGTLTVQQSQKLSDLLRNAEISHETLDASSDAAEARIIKKAGSFGAVTLATNVAGRGTDIALEPGLDDKIVQGYVALVKGMLNGSDYHIELHCSSTEERSLLLKALSADEGLHITEESDDANAGPYLIVSNTVGASRTSAVMMEFGLGLHVVGTELNQSSRLDRQLRGRSGRQGAPGTTRFIVSMEDQLLAYRRGEAAYVGDRPQTDSAGRTYFEGSSVQRHVCNLQRNQSDDDASERDILNEYTRLQEAQTAAYYSSRSSIFQVNSFHGICENHLREACQRLVIEFLPDLGVSDYRGQFQRLCEEVRTEFGVDVSELDGLSANELAGDISDMLLDALDEKFEAVDADNLDALKRQLYLQISDEQWRDHLSVMQELMLSVSLIGQDRKHAVAEYAIRSHQKYETLSGDVADEFMCKLFQFPLDDLVSPDGQILLLDEEIAGILA
jgi:preprotein translocase subunit SecA